MIAWATVARFHDAHSSSLYFLCRDRVRRKCSLRESEGAGTKIEQEFAEERRISADTNIMIYVQRARRKKWKQNYL